MMQVGNIIITHLHINVTPANVLIPSLTGMPFARSMYKKEEYVPSLKKRRRICTIRFCSDAQSRDFEIRKVTD